MRLAFEFETTKSPKEVFSYIGENFFKNHTKWDPGIVEMIKLSDGPIHKSTKGREIDQFLGKHPADFEITAYQPNKLFSLSNTSGPFLLDRVYRFKLTKKGTRVNFSFDLQPRSAAIKPVYPVLKRIFKKKVHENVVHLQKLLKSQESV